MLLDVDDDLMKKKSLEIISNFFQVNVNVGYVFVL